MPTLPRLPFALGALAASALVLAGCAGTPEADASDDRISVVASTNVYGQIAEQIGGDRVAVTSLISSDSQDPHSFEPSARDQLAIAKADLIIENGGGYDAFVDALIESSGAEAPVLTASEFSAEWPGESAHDDSEDPHAEDEHAEDGHEHADEDGHHHEHVEGFNEHVWYDSQAMADLARGIAAELRELSPADAEAFSDAADAFVGEIDELDAELSGIREAHAGASVFVTEPVPVYLVTAAGLTDVTPNAFSEAVEEGQDVAPATLLEALGLVGSGDVAVVITNAQTGGAETGRIVEEAKQNDVPVIGFSETLPAGKTYISWMRANIEALSTALGA